MNKEQLKHMFDSSACLSARQLKNYASGKMVHEEAHTVEVHLLSCPFCTDALDGIKKHLDTEAADTIEKMDAKFLHKHFKDLPAAKAPIKTPKIKKVAVPKTVSFNPQLIKNIGIAAGIILIAGVFWFMRDSIFTGKTDNEQIAQNTEPVTEQSDLRPAFEEEAETEATDTMANDALVSTQEIPSVLPADNIDKEKLITAPKPPASPVNIADANNNADVGPPTLKEVAPGVAKDMEREIKKENKLATTTSANEQDEYYSKRLGNSYEVKDEPKPEVQAESSAATGIERADELYNSGKYRRALKHYQEEMFNTKNPAKDQATYMAAQCHLKLGETTQAKTLLNSLIKENTSLQGKAKKQLDNLD